jgi:NADH:ubiquinone oxidoreductase subunit 6 (subunit J)
MGEIVQILLSILIVFSAMMVAESKKIVRVAQAFSIMSTLIAIFFITFSAYYAAAFQLAIYAGFISIIILVSVALMKGGEEVED